MTMNPTINDVVNANEYGCWIDGGHYSGDYLSYKIIKLAYSFGYDVDIAQVESDMAEYDHLTYEEQGDISQGLWEESALAIDWMNNEIEDKRLYFYVDDNSLFLEYDDEMGLEYNIND